MALKVPTFVVVSKVDLCSSEQLQAIKHQLKEVLGSPGCNRVPVFISNEGEVYNSAQNFTHNSV